MTGVSKSDQLLGLRPVERAFATATRNKLRVLALHGVPDPGVFRAQLRHIADDYRPVTGSQVADAYGGGPDLPPNAVWVTFDDGRADVVEAGMAELDRAGVPATMFVCPGLIEAGAPFWWDVVTGALADGGPFSYDGRDWQDRTLVTALKRVPDEQRREVVATLAARTPSSDGAAVLTPEQVKAWVASGHEIGNHTWDHPCLDQCPPGEQARQISTAHEALTAMLGGPPDLFAYPNGDWADAAERALVECGYRVGLLFDHRLASRSQHSLRLSRLRLDSDAPLARARAILSGGHSGIFQLRERIAARTRAT